MPDIVPGVSGLLQPPDIEPFAESPQVDAVDLAVAGVADRPLLGCRSIRPYPPPTDAPRNDERAKVARPAMKASAKRPVTS